VQLSLISKVIAQEKIFDEVVKDEELRTRILMPTLKQILMKALER